MNAQRWPMSIVAIVLIFALSATAGGQVSRGGKSAEDDLRVIVEQLLNEIQQLRNTVEELQARIDQLEEDRANADEAADAEYEDIDDDSNRLGSVRVLKIESVTLLPADASLFKRASDKRKQASAKESEIAALENERNKLMGCRYWPHCHCRNPDVHRDSELERKRKRDDLSKRIVRLRSDARRLKSEADRLERDGKITRHEIRGWDGFRTVVLHTEKDCTAVLNEVSAGAFIQWNGKLVSDDDGVQTWSATRIAAVPRPEKFAERPT